jgi:hypothetical protein
MSMPMPIGDYRWVSKRKKKKLKWEEMKRDQEKGYFVEVDLEYPPNLHLDHNSFPLAPEHLDITKDMLSPYAQGKIRRDNTYKSIHIPNFQIVYQSSTQLKRHTPLRSCVLHLTNGKNMSCTT